MREKESALRLGFTYAGCFLGAGYVSGQELWQFFGRFGENGLGIAAGDGAVPVFRDPAAAADPTDRH